MNVLEIEHASLRAWPALEEVELEGGILRYAQGVSRRSNALVPSANGQFCPQRLIKATKAYYDSKQQAAVVKVLTQNECDGVFSSLDTLLENDSYEKESPTSVMAVSMQSYKPRLAGISLQHPMASTFSLWVEAWHSIRDFNPDQMTVHQQILERMSGQVHCLVLQDSYGQACATGMAVLNGGKLGIFGMSTRQDFRGQGCATRIMDSLIAWGLDGGANYAYLQVENSNRPALSLYKKLGFHSLYTYWYRVKEFIDKS